MKHAQEKTSFRFTPAGILNAIRSADRLAVIGLLAANILPILLAVVFGWEVSDVVFFYWWENVVIGLFAILRILLAKGEGAFQTMNGSKFFLVPFFTAHYFFFCFIHVTFLRVFFKDGKNIVSPFEFLQDLWSNLNDLLPVAGWVGIIGLLASHGVSFARNYIKGGEYKKALSFVEMFRPYGRNAVLHIGIIAGGFAVTFLGSPMIMVVFLMVLKTAFDLVAHVTLHAMAGSMDPSKWGSMEDLLIRAEQRREELNRKSDDS